MTVAKLLRPLFRRYPFKHGKSLIQRLLLPHPDAIPEGEIVRCVTGVLIRVHPDAMYNTVFLFGEYEPATTVTYAKLLRSGNVVFDIGANFGWFSTLFAQIVGPSGH